MEDDWRKLKVLGSVFDAGNLYKDGLLVEDIENRKKYYISFLGGINIDGFDDINIDANELIKKGLVVNEPKKDMYIDVKSSILENTPYHLKFDNNFASYYDHELDMDAYHLYPDFGKDDDPERDYAEERAMERVSDDMEKNLRESVRYEPGLLSYYWCWEVNQYLFNVDYNKQGQAMDYSIREELKRERAQKKVRAIVDNARKRLKVKEEKKDGVGRKSKQNEGRKLISNLQKVLKGKREI